MSIAFHGNHFLYKKHYSIPNRGKGILNFCPTQEREGGQLGYEMVSKYNKIRAACITLSDINKERKGGMGRGLQMP